ncbi:MAG: aminoacyl-tRNA hydrolase [Saprospiraceae bacterium]
MNKYLVVGLGNPGKEYENTRHNIGFLMLDYLVNQVKGTWNADRFGWRADIRIKGRSITLIKPDTYVNLSGKAVSFWMHKLNIEPQNTLVILDDLNIPFGTLRMRKNGSDGGHNGLKSIQESIPSKEYPRLRIGIGNNFPKGRQVNYVLGSWSAEEQKDLTKIYNACAEGILQFALAGPDKTMSKLNAFTLEEDDKKES